MHRRSKSERGDRADHCAQNVPHFETHSHQLEGKEAQYRFRPAPLFMSAISYLALSSRDGAGLEICCTVLRTGGSNPSLSARSNAYPIFVRKEPDRPR